VDGNDAPPSEQLVGLDRWTTDLERRARKLLARNPARGDLDQLADEYDALAHERDEAAKVADGTAATTQRVRAAYTRKRALLLRLR
jgi:hypothetical protein